MKRRGEDSTSRSCPRVTGRRDRQAQGWPQDLVPLRAFFYARSVRAAQTDRSRAVHREGGNGVASTQHPTTCRPCPGGLQGRKAAAPL